MEEDERERHEKNEIELLIFKSLNRALNEMKTKVSVEDLLITIGTSGKQGSIWSKIPLVILICQICFLACMSQHSKSNENEKNDQTAVAEVKRNSQDSITFAKYQNIPKTKVVGGRLFDYVEPRYEYRDESGQWYIFERPKGIFTYWYREGQNDGKSIGAFKIDFYSDTTLIKSIDLASMNPYTKSRYPALSAKIIDRSGESGSNFPRPVGKVVSEYAKYAYAYSVIRESDDNYIIVDYIFMGYDRNGGFINQEHTFIVYDNVGVEKARIEHIENPISDPVVTHRFKYFTYLINNDEENLNTLVVKDLKNKVEVFKSDKSDPRFIFGEPHSLSKDQTSLTPYNDRDSCYIMLYLRNITNDALIECDIIPYYLDIENRMIYTGCYSNKEWSGFDFPHAHYTIIEQNAAKSIKF